MTSSMTSFRTFRAALLALTLLAGPALHPGQARAYAVFNETGARVTTWVDPGTFRRDLAAGENGSCDLNDAGCNPGGSPTALVKAWIVSYDRHFSCIMPMEAGGYVAIRERSRQSLGLPPALYCQSYGADRRLMHTEGYADAGGARSIRFLATADPQYFWRNDSDSIDTYSFNRVALATTRRMLFLLLSSCTPEGCGIRGITISGDLTNWSRRSEFQWYGRSIAGYHRFVFDGLGNHDKQPDPYYCGFAPYTCVDVGRIQAYMSHDRQRSTAATNAGDPHYSWDWGDVHFVQHNQAAMDEPSPVFRELSPNRALQWLKEDLARYVGTSGRPVVLFHHYGFDGTSTDPNEQWWTPAQRELYWDVLAGYNVAAIFTGHYHAGPGEERYVPWARPAGGHAGPDTIATFIAGAALNAAFMDVKIEGNTMTVTPMGLANHTDSTSAVVAYTPRVIAIRSQERRQCRATVLYLLGNDHVVAEFSVPESAHGTAITWKDGAAHTYRFPRCYRVWWKDQAATCSDGLWVRGPTGEVGRDAACHGAQNTDQPYLKVTYP
jgi:hypothetical protein